MVRRSYDPEAHAFIRYLPKVKWDPAKRYWIFSFFDDLLKKFQKLENSKTT
ncbi:hypothetical protein [Leptospira interrogans]|uniref:hypothetical protein n=1 Tax=Leptospira interrogans TaxID=173 RepID=UPI000A8200AB|nr:hypothetical protein [Leptospira interrogans]